MENNLDLSLINNFIENQKNIAEIEIKISNAIASFKAELEQRQNKEIEIKEAIKKAMLKNGVKKFENDVILLNYIAPTTRKTLDTAKLKEEKPDIYEEYSKVGEVSDSIRIKIK
jgi:predicted phage-related endonuclease